MLAGFLLAQLENKEHIQARRKSIWSFYHENLADWANNFGVQQPSVPAHCEQSYHMYYLLFPSLEIRQEFIQYLRGKGINAVFHYLPLNNSKMGLKYGGKPGDCPIAERVSDQLVRLPMHLNLSESDLEYVVGVVSSFKY
jgi:dTDP-4-amino-4,6-dideoxygalactose transaminase